MLNVVVIGNGMVGHHYVEQLAASPIVARITVIGGETRPAYDRVHLSEYFAGRSPEDLALTTREHYIEIGVEAHFGDPVNLAMTNWFLQLDPIPLCPAYLAATIILVWFTERSMI
jgi:NAD(P)H-nitrite reductase large subunit